MQEVIAVPKIVIKIEKENPETLSPFSVIGDMYLDELAVSIRDYDNTLVLNPIPVADKELINSCMTTTVSATSIIPVVSSNNDNITSTYTVTPWIQETVLTQQPIINQNIENQSQYSINQTSPFQPDTIKPQYINQSEQPESSQVIEPNLQKVINLSSQNYDNLQINKHPQQSEQLITHLNQQPISHLNQQPISHPNQQPITHLNQQPITHPNQQPISHSNQQPISHPNQQPISHLNQQPIVNPIKLSFVNANQQTITNPPAQQYQLELVESDSSNLYTLKAVSLRDPSLAKTVGNEQSTEDIVYMKCLFDYIPIYNDDGYLISEPLKAKPLQAKWIKSLTVPGITDNTNCIVVSCDNTQVDNLQNTVIKVNDSNNCELENTETNAEDEIQEDVQKCIENQYVSNEHIELEEHGDELDESSEFDVEEESSGSDQIYYSDNDSDVTLHNDPIQSNNEAAFDNNLQTNIISESNQIVSGTSYSRDPNTLQVPSFSLGKAKLSFIVDNNIQNTRVAKESRNNKDNPMEDTTDENMLSAGGIENENVENLSPERRLRELLSNEQLLSFHQDSFCGSSTPRSLSPQKHVKEPYVESMITQHQYNIPSIMITSSATPRHQPLSSRGRYVIPSGADNPVVVRTVAGPISESPGEATAMLPYNYITNSPTTSTTTPAVNQHDNHNIDTNDSNKESDDIERSKTNHSGKNIVLLELLCHMFRSNSANLVCIIFIYFIN